ncbi:hypothetical protein Dimus_018030, partial [Dionaea muscipula]
MRGSCPCSYAGTVHQSGGLAISLLTPLPQNLVRKKNVAALVVPYVCDRNIEIQETPLGTDVTRAVLDFFTYGRLLRIAQDWWLPQIQNPKSMDHTRLVVALSTRTQRNVAPDEHREDEHDEQDSDKTPSERLPQDPYASSKGKDSIGDDCALIEGTSRQVIGSSSCEGRKKTLGVTTSTQ